MRGRVRSRRGGSTLRLISAGGVAVVLCGCGPRECDPAQPDACETNFACEDVAGRRTPICVPAVQVEGHVFDLATAKPISGAQIIAVDDRGRAVNAVVVSADDGSFTLTVHSRRLDDSGRFVPRKLTLFAQAQNFYPFPTLLRPGRVLDTGTVLGLDRNERSPWVIRGSAEIGLISLPRELQNHSAISGTVAMLPDQFAVMVSTSEGHSVLADNTGAYRIFNVPDGRHELNAYARAVAYSSIEADVSAVNGTPPIDFSAGTDNPLGVTGALQLLPGANSVGSSVELAVSPSVPGAQSMVAPIPGLRAPEPPLAPNVTADWRIDGVPPFGYFFVLSAYENDGNVALDSPRVVTMSGNSEALAEPVRVAAAVQLEFPGASGDVDIEGSTPIFRWKAYPGATHYAISVRDVLGNEQWTTTAGTAPPLTVNYSGPQLSAGMIYQWQVRALDANEALLSRSEDLLGYFQID